MTIRDAWNFTRPFVTLQTLNGVLIVLLPFVSILFALLRIDVTAILAVIGAIGIALAFTNVDKISRFKSTILEIEMREIADKAQAAITDLKNLALALTSPIVAMYTLEGTGQIFGTIPFKTKLRDVGEIKNLLKQFGATDKEIEASCGVLNSVVVNIHVRHILVILKALNAGESNTLFKDVNDFAVVPQMTVEQIRELIKTHNLQTADFLEEAIRDYEHYLTTGEIRKPEKRRFG